MGMAEFSAQGLAKLKPKCWPALFSSGDSGRKFVSMFIEVVSLWAVTCGLLSTPILKIVSTPCHMAHGLSANPAMGNLVESLLC